jgi:coniferyl-aldehyde dehydrogenase
VNAPIKNIATGILGIDELHATFAKQKTAFLLAPPPSAKERIDHLRAMASMVLDYRDRIHETLCADFGAHPKVGSDLIEVGGVAQRALYTAGQVKQWMKPERRQSDFVKFGTSKAFVAYQPKGVIGNIVPWNFPFDTSLGPLCDMLASGNRCIIKPSELSPASGALLKEMLAKTFSADQVAVINGGLELAKVFPTLRWDHLLYTGSPQIGTLVARAAAENLVPVTLELGGKSPVIFSDDSVNAENVGHMLSVKLVKSGQMCISPDYCLVPRTQMTQFISLAQEHFKGALANYSSGADCTGVISDRQLQRNLRLLDEAQAQGSEVIQLDVQGALDIEKRRMPVSLVIDPNDRLGIMQEEIFGPMLAVKPYDSLNEAIAYINRGERPLALYLFTKNREIVEQVQNKTTSGGFCVNACAAHGAVHSLGFGGIGHSGTGRHHGIDGFREFSNPRGVFIRGWGGIVDKVFAPPHGRFAQRVAALSITESRVKLRGLWTSLIERIRRR